MKNKCQACGTYENVTTYHGNEDYNYWCQACAASTAQAEYDVYIQNKYGKIPTISEYFDLNK